MTLPSTLQRFRSPLRVALAVLALGLGVQTIVVIVSQTAGGVPASVLDWTATAALAAAATVCTVRAVTEARARTAWSLLSLGAWCWVAGNVVWSLTLAPRAETPFPSTADALWLAFYPLALAGFVLLVCSDRRPVHARGAMLLDGLVVSLTVTAASGIAVIDPVRSTLGGSFADVATNAAYPLADLVLTVTVLTMFAVYHWRPPRMLALLGLGVVLDTVANSVYLVQVADDSVTDGVLLDLLWSISLAAIALAVVTSSAPSAQPRTPTSSLAVTTLFSAVAVGLLITGTLREIPLVAVVAATGAIVASLARTSLALGDLRALAQARHEASTDELTGLDNRRRFLRELDAQIARPGRDDRSLGLVLIDLDHFKAFNDTLGHEVGDVLLQHAARRIMEAVAPRGRVARIGGDEFAILVNDGGPIEDVARHVAGELLTPFDLDGASVTIGASMGISVFPRDGATTEELVRHADLAMVEAKHSSSPFAFYEPSRDDRSRRRYLLMTELPLAVDRDELVLHYQPKLDLRTGSVDAVEALVRWRHSRHGLLPPAEFLSVFEQIGLMPRLTGWVIRTALRETASSGLQVAVNVSTPCLLSPGFTCDVTRLLDESGAVGQALLLEITEDVVMADADRARSALHALSELGVELSLDDFGTGYSSLGYLAELEVDELKIDRSFVTRMEHDGSPLIVRTLVDLAHNLGLRVVAEGVETAESIERIRALGGDVVQGFAVTRPLPLAELTVWLDAQRSGSDGLTSVD